MSTFFVQHQGVWTRVTSDDSLVLYSTGENATVIMLNDDGSGSVIQDPDGLYFGSLKPVVDQKRLTLIALQCSKILDDDRFK